MFAQAIYDARAGHPVRSRQTLGENRTAKDGGYLVQLLEYYRSRRGLPSLAFVISHARNQRCSLPVDGIYGLLALMTP